MEWCFEVIVNWFKVIVVMKNAAIRVWPVFCMPKDIFNKKGGGTNGKICNKYSG